MKILSVMNPDFITDFALWADDLNLPYFNNYHMVTVSKIKNARNTALIFSSFPSPFTNQQACITHWSLVFLSKTFWDNNSPETTGSEILLSRTNTV